MPKNSTDSWFNLEYEGQEPRHEAARWIAEAEAERKLRSETSPSKSKEEEPKLREEDFDSLYEYDHARLNQIIIKNSLTNLKNQRSWDKLKKQSIAPLAKAGISLAWGEVSAWYSEFTGISATQNHEGGSTEESAAHDEDTQASKLLQGMSSQTMLVERMKIGKELVTDLVKLAASTELKPDEIVKASFDEWKVERQPYVETAHENVKKAIVKKDGQIESASMRSVYGLDLLWTHIDDRIWLSGLPQERKDITHRNDPEARMEQRRALDEILDMAPDQESADQREINYQRIINASDTRNPEPSRLIIWKGDIGGTGKTEDTENAAKKALGLEMFTHNLGNSEEVRETFIGAPHERHKGTPLIARMPRLIFMSGIARKKNSIHYLNEGDKGLKDPQASSRMKRLFDTKNTTYPIPDLNLDYPIDNLVIIGDGNDALSKFLDKPGLERISLEDYNVTKASKRLSILEEQVEKAVNEQSLSDEKKRPELRDFMQKMRPIIYDVNESVNEQSYRPSKNVATNVAALAKSAIERGEQPDLERCKKQVLKYYKQFHPEVHDIYEKAKNPEESKGVSSSGDASLSSGIGNLRIASASENLSPRTKKILQRDELALGELLEQTDKVASGNWRKYVALNPRQKEAATRLYKARQEDKNSGVKEEDLIANSEHSHWLEAIPRKPTDITPLISTHNLLNGISSPTPSATNTRPSSRQSNTSGHEVSR